MKLLSLHPLGKIAVPRIGLLADSIEDPNSTRKVYLLAAGLAVLGIALVVITVWFWRSTRHDPELLAPLEAIGARKFKKLDGGTQQATVDAVRPAGAIPMRWGVRRGEAGSEAIDLRSNVRTGPAGFEDLHDPALIAVATAESIEPGADISAAIDRVVVSRSADDIDSALAAVGAKLDLPAGTTVHAAASAPAVSAVPAVPAPVVASTPAVFESAVAREPAASRAEGESDAKPAPIRIGGQQPARPSAMEPLVIVPVDHEIRPAAIVSLPGDAPRPASLAVEPEVDDATTAGACPDADQSQSIDPLLRMFNRSDS